ncbi:uncharacterized protein LOC133832486 [Humulus lupulus]|uniref:uncharacterized protein LOC133832486 n=1 Tax=Humulus lupulus TaxID=3486 RepID=UPI002B404FB4|nr:uncharacterized protein LOC133832486 [Humulus lupulus]
MKGEQKEARECYNTSLHTSVKPQEPIAMVIHGGTNPQELDPRITEEIGFEPVEELEEIVVMEEPLRKLKMGKNLQDDTKEILVRFLKDNLNVFALSHEDMVGIDPSIMCHHLNINPEARPVRQKRRALDPERYAALKEEVLDKPETSGRLVKWSIKLSQFDITYTQRNSINGQVLIDFIVEFTYRPNEEGDIGKTKSIGKEEERKFEEWTLHVNGAFNEGGVGEGIMMTGPGGHKMYCSIRFGFEASNNKVEYEALLARLELAKGLKVTHLHIFSDSQLVVFQVKGEYQARGPKMVSYLTRVKGYLEQLEGYSIEKIPRERNTQVDALVKLASTKDGDTLEFVPVEYLSKPSIIEAKVYMINTPKESWVDPIMKYLKDRTLPKNKRDARRLAYKATRYTLVDGVLYKRGFSVPLMWCVDEEEAMKVLYEKHEGERGNHASWPSTTRKATRQGYYWPSMENDASDFLKKCDKFKRHTNYSRKPPNELTSLTNPWSFPIWGIDLIGALPIGRGGAKYPVIVINYFTEWVEAEPLINITTKQIATFFNKSIVCRHGVPYKIISDNST